MISARAVQVVRRGRSLLTNIDIDVNDGEVLGLVGPNGSGKSTLLRCLYGACAMERGTVRLNGAPLSSLSRRSIARLVAVVPQGQTGHMDQIVSEIVALGRLPHQSWFSSARSQDDDAIIDALNRVGLIDKAQVPITRLSGGEWQRVLIARALCQQAKHLLLDEPTNHLDLSYQHAILRFVRGLGLATMIVLHDLNLAARYCDRIALLDGGRLVAFGTAQDVLTPERIAKTYRVPTHSLSTPAGRQHLIFADTPYQEEI